MGFASRLPTSNDLPIRKDKSPWLGDNELLDETALLLGGLAKRCVKCNRATHIRHLDGKKLCPDCGGNIKTNPRPPRRWHGGCACGEPGEAD